MLVTVWRHFRIRSMIRKDPLTDVMVSRVVKQQRKKKRCQRKRNLLYYTYYCTVCVCVWPVTSGSRAIRSAARVHWGSRHRRCAQPTNNNNIHLINASWWLHDWKILKWSRTVCGSLLFVACDDLTLEIGARVTISSKNRTTTTFHCVYVHEILWVSSCMSNQDNQSRKKVEFSILIFPPGVVSHGWGNRLSSSIDEKNKHNNILIDTHTHTWPE